MTTYYINKVGENDKRNPVRRKNGERGKSLRSDKEGSSNEDFNNRLRSNEDEFRGSRRSRARKEKLAIDCILLKYNALNTTCKPSLFRPKFMQKNKVDSVILKFRRVTTRRAYEKGTDMLLEENVEGIRHDVQATQHSKSNTSL
uniref:Uncharacterized protein n=1 Tax=Cacopsylla melanoneura TaxID=428564 RepID=A0A8D8X3N0_9HEMI